VVPELASRHHVEQISQVVDSALDEAGVTLQDLDLIGATRAPGLVGSLLVGLSYAKALAFAMNLPFVGVHHIEGHIHAVFLEERIPHPFLCLVVSGGHTELIRVQDFGHYRILGRTRDDAAGEAFDKVAKMMGLGYPGGPVLDRLSEEGDPGFVTFPRSMISEDSFDFSFSGLKTAVMNFLLKNGWGPEGEGAEALRGHLPDIAAAFQDAVVDVLVAKTSRAMKQEKLCRLVLAGGVVSNRFLRRRFSEEAKRAGYSLHVPSPVLCTDNAAMIAAVASRSYERGVRDSLDLNAVAHLPLGSS